MRAASQGAALTSDDRLDIASLIRSATVFGTMMRQHWDSENKLHWSLDVTCNEDRCRIRKEHAPENVAAVRYVALHLLRQEQSRQISLRQQRLCCGLDEHSLLTVRSGAT
jgi:predicted transposase YbfD/YdcC